MKRMIMGMLLLLIIAVAGCSVQQQGQCDPPAKAMTDENGNTICVLGNFSQDSGTDNVSEEPAVNESMENKTENVTEMNETENVTEKNVTDENVTETNVTQENVTESNVTESNVTEENATGAPNMTEENVTEQNMTAENETDYLASRTVTAGDTVSFADLSATDPDGDELTFYYSAPLNASGEWATESEDVGEHSATVTVSDGVHNVSEEVLITVEQSNRPPVLEDPADMEVTEGEMVNVSPQVGDPDGDNVTLSYSEPLSENGVWQTSEGDAGSYEITVTASDGVLEVSESFLIEVVSANSAPVISDLEESITVQEGETVSLEPTVTDPDGDNVTVTYSGWMDSAEYTTDYDDSGVYEVTVTATDGEASSEQVVEVTVEDVNRPPEFEE